MEKIKITFLGTSAQIPSAKRNHAATLLTYKGENILVDCGEGIQRQFRKAHLNPCKITRILLTHKHGDHVFGLLGLLSTLGFSGYNKELVIYGPRGIKKFLNHFLSVLNLERNFKLQIKEVSGKFFETDEFYLEAGKMEHGIPTNAYNFVLKDKLRIDKAKLKKAKIKAGPLMQKLKQGKDIVFEKKKFKAKDLTYLEKGKKVSFVLDTLNNKRIAKFVEGANVFISEASFSAAESKEAKDHFHLTSEQAGEIANKAKVGKLYLTHVSQRYEKNLKEILNDAKKEFKDSFLVEDLDEVEI